MKNNSYIKIGIFMIIGIACVIGGVYYILNAKGVDTRKAKTEISITTNELFENFNNDKEASYAKYIEKAFEIKGTLYKVTRKGEKYSLLLRGKQIENRLVLCEMEVDQGPIVETLKIGDEVKVKGILKGFLMDAILLNCIILEEVNE